MRDSSFKNEKILNQVTYEDDLDNLIIDLMTLKKGVE
jgi:hypothetical protein